MITDKTDFGIDESGYVMSNLKATINSSKDLTQHTLGHNPKPGCNILGAVRKHDKIIYAMICYYVDDQTGDIENSITVFENENLFEVGKGTESRYDFSEMFGEKFKSLTKNRVHSRNNEVAHDKIDLTAVLAQLNVRDVNLTQEEQQEDITGLKKMAKHVWVELRKNEMVWKTKRGRKKKLIDNTIDNNTIINEKLADDVIFTKRATSTAEKATLLLQFMKVLVPLMQKDGTCEFDDDEKLNNKLKTWEKQIKAAYTANKEEGESSVLSTQYYSTFAFHHIFCFT